MPAIGLVAQHPAAFAREAAGEGVPDRQRSGIAQLEVETVPAALVVDLQNDSVLTRDEVQLYGVFAGRHTPGDVLREDPLAVQPDPEAIVAAEIRRQLPGLVRSDRAVEPGRGEVDLRELMHYAVDPGGTLAEPPVLVELRHVDLKLGEVFRRQGVGAPPGRELDLRPPCSA
jgi:hypothetical protein